MKKSLSIAFVAVFAVIMLSSTITFAQTVTTAPPQKSTVTKDDGKKKHKHHHHHHHNDHKGDKK